MLTILRKSQRSPRRSLLRLCSGDESRANGYRKCKRGSEPRRQDFVAQRPVHADPPSQLAVKLAELEDYKTLLSERPSLKKAEFLSKLSEMTPFETESELESYIKRTEADIRRKQRKDQGEDAEPEEEPTFPLVDRPDEELNEEEIKEKRRQRLMKSGWEARVKIREEKQRERERLVGFFAGRNAEADMTFRRRNSAKKRRKEYEIRQVGQRDCARSRK